jgi:hypothetical protein
MDKEKALKLVLDDLMAEYGMERTSFAKRVDEIFKQALAAQPATEESSAVATPVQEPVAFLANGTRFKISYDSRQSGGQIHGIPPELGGRWVAFVAADDDCHLKLTSPPAQRTWVGLTVEEIRKCFQIMYDKQENWPVFANSIEAKLKEKNT